MSAVHHHLLCECPACRAMWPDSPTATPPPDELIREGVQEWREAREATAHQEESE